MLTRRGPKSQQNTTSSKMLTRRPPQWSRRRLALLSGRSRINLCHKLPQNNHTQTDAFRIQIVYNIEDLSSFKSQSTEKSAMGLSMPKR